MKKFIAGAVMGGALSATASLLLTPKKGSEMRTEAQVKYRELKEKTTELIQKMKEKTNKTEETVVETNEVIVISEEKEEKIS